MDQSHLLGEGGYGYCYATDMEEVDSSSRLDQRLDNHHASAPQRPPAEWPHHSLTGAALKEYRVKSNSPPDPPKARSPPKAEDGSPESESPKYEEELDDGDGPFFPSSRGLVKPIRDEQREKAADPMFPSPHQFDMVVYDYLKSLSSKKRDKALLTQSTYDDIMDVLVDPKNTKNMTAQFRFWAKKMFALTTFGDERVICHENKPVAVKEQIFEILCHCHVQCQHGGRDKTSGQVRLYYSWIPKEVIARFVRDCPLCQSRRTVSVAGIGPMSASQAFFLTLQSSEPVDGKKTISLSQARAEATTYGLKPYAKPNPKTIAGPDGLPMANVNNEPMPEPRGKIKTKQAKRISEAGFGPVRRRSTRGAHHDSYAIANGATASMATRNLSSSVCEPLDTNRMHVDLSGMSGYTFGSVETTFDHTFGVPDPSGFPMPSRLPPAVTSTFTWSNDYQMAPARGASFDHGSYLTNTGYTQDHSQHLGLGHRRASESAIAPFTDYTQAGMGGISHHSSHLPFEGVSDLNVVLQQYPNDQASHYTLPDVSVDPHQVGLPEPHQDLWRRAYSNVDLPVNQAGTHSNVAASLDEMSISRYSHAPIVMPPMQYGQDSEGALPFHADQYNVNSLHVESLQVSSRSQSPLTGPTLVDEPVPIQHLTQDSNMAPCVEDAFLAMENYGIDFGQITYTQLHDGSVQQDTSMSAEDVSVQLENLIVKSEPVDIHDDISNLADLLVDHHASCIEEADASVQATIAEMMDLDKTFESIDFWPPTESGDPA